MAESSKPLRSLYVAGVFILIFSGCGGNKQSNPPVDSVTAVQTDQPATGDFSSESIKNGSQVYKKYCLECHQSNGSGVSGMYPPLAGNPNLQGDPEPLIQVVLKGKNGTLQVNGKSYTGIMASHAFLTDAEIADVLTYIRGSMGNSYPPVDTGLVKNFR